MREKDIKRQVLKQLKKQFPNWRKLPRKEKKRFAGEVLASIVAKSANEQASGIPIDELTETPIPREGIIKLTEMEAFIRRTTRNLLVFPGKPWPKRFENAELQGIDKLNDDRVVNELLAPEGYTPSMRGPVPSPGPLDQSLQDSEPENACKPLGLVPQY